MHNKKLLYYDSKIWIFLQIMDPGIAVTIFNLPVSNLNQLKYFSLVAGYLWCPVSYRCQCTIFISCRMQS